MPDKDALRAAVFKAVEDYCAADFGYSFDPNNPIVRLHEPDLSEALTRRMVEVVRMVRDLDLKKPPSIAESIDWARALLLLGADDIDQETFNDTMSIIVKHRTDLDIVVERVGAKLGGPLGAGA